MLPIGIYEQVVNEVIHNELENLTSEFEFCIQKSPIDSVTSQEVLSNYLAKIISKVFISLDRRDHEIEDRVSLANELIRYMAHFLSKQPNPDVDLIRRLDNYWIHKEGEMLLAIAEKQTGLINKKSKWVVTRPTTSVARQTLFTGAAQEPRMDSEIRREILSCKQIDWLVSFVKWTGLRLIMDELKEFTEKGGKLRVITTSYLGATDYKAVLWLSELKNAEIKISYDTERTRLHAKTYVFWRDTGFSTAYIGSSNLSESAMTSGLEWNIKISEYDSKPVLQKIDATFETYWNSTEFVLFNPRTDANKLKIALQKGKGIDSGKNSALDVHYFDITPHHYQQEILDQLDAERRVHGHFKNLVVAATGTGKTVVSAFDYKRYQKGNDRARLLFVAHRKEILIQSLQCYRNILRQSNFGGLLVDGIRPESLEHVFVSIQSLNSTGFIESLPSNYYDFIVVDEFHHAAAPSYKDLLDHFKPKILLGLTATPERADGQSIFEHFDNPDAIQLRLVEAIERKLLSPFHYFGVSDNIDYRQVRWQAGRYSVEDLNNLIVLDEFQAQMRAEQIKLAIENYALDWSEIKGIGFCVSKKHAEFMAGYFNDSGIPSDCLTADSDPEIRESVKQRLVLGKILFVFVVDIYNEGVDIPEINTVLFLRPTESLTVFLQQLGRGLRLSQGKEALTVIDFVGRQRAEYNFEGRFRALMKQTRKSVTQEIEAGFVHVPKGCAIYLEKVAQKTVLDHIAGAVNNKRQVLRKIKDWKHGNHSNNFLEFFRYWHVSPIEVYKIDSKNATISGLSEQPGSSKDLDKLLGKGYARLSQVKAVHWLKWLLENLPDYRNKNFKLEQFMKNDSNSKVSNELKMIYLNILYYTFLSDGADKNGMNLEDALIMLFGHKCYFDELMAVVQYTYDQQDQVTMPLGELNGALELYGAYTVNMILSALGKHTYKKCYPFREGVLYLSEQDMDVFFITLNKSEADFTETTLYDDYAINEKLFHWQSQSRTTIQSPTGQRYVNQNGSDRKVLLFARAYKQDQGFTGLYTCLGFADYVRHEGSAPISIVWQLRNRMPAKLLELASKAE
ncbi:DUF3427 domain-containing protein [Alkalibacter sp. M17DMB]|nr:DUF3427 domain-containing protein [Alkalibacter mobilis]